MTETLAAPTELFERLRLPEPGVWHEARQPDGLLRPSWQRFVEQLPDGETPASMDARRHAIARQIHIDGGTHNIHGDGVNALRDWSLELLPMIVEAGDWSIIESGVIQQARLLQALMSDLYGPKHAVHQGLLPARLVFRHRGYLRALAGVQPVGGRHLHVVAFDVARGADGRWCIVSRRAQSPSGLGYALHNRSVLSRMFFDAYRDLNVRPLGDALTHLTRTIRDLATPLSEGGSPRVVLLTPGATDRSWFEHAYLARQVGATLVHGGDLTVRNERLYLKTVQGLERVHGVLRRIDDAECDPLELDAHSALGVPGLMHVVRAGQVALLNALGSEVLESPALEGFLPGLAKMLLGESLMLPPLDSWWCGEAAAHASVATQLVNKFVRKTFADAASSAHPAERTQRVAASEVALWQARIAADPEAWTVQAPVTLSRTLVWRDGRATPAPVLLRVYAMADAQGRWHVMPGGMGHVGAPSASTLAMDRGGDSLDTWVTAGVQAPHRVAQAEALPPRVTTDVSARRHPLVASRTAETLFWFGRYSERTEQSVRLLRAIIDRINNDAERTPSLERALHLMASEAFLVNVKGPALQASGLGHAILETLSHGHIGLETHLRSLTNTAAELPDHLSPEHAALVRGLVENFRSDLQQAAGRGAVGSPTAAFTLAHARTALDRLTLRLAANNGMQGDHMTRDLSWRFLAIGRLIERLQRLAEAMVALEDAGALPTPAGVELLLQLFDSTMTYNARYHRHGDLLATMDLLVSDENNPRSYAAVMDQLAADLQRLPDAADLLAVWRQKAPAPEALEAAALRDLDDVGVSKHLESLSRHLIRASSELSDEIGRRYFVHVAGHARLHRA